MAALLPAEILLPARTICRRGALASVPAEALRFGAVGCIVHGRSLVANGMRDRLAALFPAAASITFFPRLSGEPTLDEVADLRDRACAAGVCWIVGVGGGSVLDLAKAAAGLLHAAEAPRYYQQGGLVREEGVPFIAVPTTAGTGSEATPNAVIGDPVRRSKTSIRDRSFLARTVILDPELIVGAPAAVMSYAALDAFAQAYEAYTSVNATSFSDGFALQAIDLINRYILPGALLHDDEACEALLVASYYAGIALAAARLGVIHGIAHPLGILYGVPHGLAVAACFVLSIRLNRAAIGEKYEKMSRIVGMPFEERITAILEALSIPAPFKGRELIEREKIIAETLASGSTAANPRQITRDDVDALLKELF